MSNAGLTIAVVGLGFGQDFVPIYLSHPEVDRVVLVEPDDHRREEIANRFAVPDARADIGDVLDDPTVDAVHILAPVPLHADLSVAVLQAGKHCACAVPMATTHADLQRIIDAQAASGSNYMMMETTVYAREYLTVERMHRDGELGRITLYDGYHIQQLDGFPSYWQGFPPMHYVTHALSPALALLDTTVTSVQCRGAGRLSTPERRSGGFDNPFPTEVGLFSFAGSDVLGKITMSFFQTARTYVEGFGVYGDEGGVEWPPDNEGPMTVYKMGPPATGSRGNTVESHSLNPPDHPELLPSELRQFVRPAEVMLPGMTKPASVGAHHGGSHPHLVDEFVRSIVDGRAPRINETVAAQWTAPGISAHESALADGARREVPTFTS